MSSSSVPQDGSGDHFVTVSGATPPAVVAGTSKDLGAGDLAKAKRFLSGTGINLEQEVNTNRGVNVEREVNFLDARRVFESEDISPSDLATTAKTTELTDSPPVPEVNLICEEGQGSPKYISMNWAPGHKRNQSVVGLLSTSPGTSPVEGGDGARRKLSITRRISISTDVDVLGELRNLADLKVAVEAVQAANNMSTPQRQGQGQPYLVAGEDHDHQEDGNNLAKIDIKQGQGVEGDVDSNEGNVLVVRELFSAKRKRYPSMETGSVAKDEVSLVSHADLDSNCSSFVNDYDWDRKARKKAFRKDVGSPGEDDINSLSVLSAAEPEVRLDLFPETMRSNDVFALLSPSKGLFEVKTCPQHFTARRELQSFLTDVANKSVLEESFISMNVVIGSPPPVIHDVSVMVIDGPEWLPYNEDAVQLFDKERNRFGSIKKIADEVTHVEVIQNQMIIMDISSDQLKPHPSAMLRCGQYVLLGDWYGMIKGVERSVRLKLSDGRKVKLNYEDNDAEGTRLSYVSGGKYSPWFLAGDIYSDPTVPTYPGQSIKVDAKIAEEHLTSPMRRCSNWVAALARRVLRRNPAVEGEGAENLCFDAVVEKVSIKTVSVIWIDPVEGSLELVSPKCIIKDGATIDALQVLGPDPQSFTRLGSLRMFTVQENSEQLDRNGWRKEMLLRFTSSNKKAPPASHDEVDVASKRFTLSRGTKPKRCKTGESVVVKVLLKYKMVEVEWEDGVKENIEMPKVLQMINQERAVRRGRAPSVSSRTESTGCPLAESSLQESRPNVTELPTESEDVEVDGLSLSNLADTTYQISRAVYADTAAAVIPSTIVGLASIDLFFRVNDFVVDATKPFSEIVKEYGIIRKVFPQDYMAKVEWFEINDNFLTSRIDPDVKRAEFSVFDLSLMKICKDPPHGITWHSSTHYSSEIVMKRSGVCQQDFKVGCVTGVNEDGKLVVSSGTNSWLLWPCEVNNIRKVSYQNELGEWKVNEEPSTFVNSYQPTSFERKLLKRQKAHELAGRDTATTSTSAAPRSQSTLDLLGRVNLNQSTLSEGAKYMETDLDASNEVPAEDGDFNLNFQSHQFLINKVAPPDHELYSYFDDLVAQDWDPVAKSKLKDLLDKEMVKMVFMGFPDGVFVRAYKDRWNLYSVLMTAPKSSPYYGAIFTFDIAITENYPAVHPMVVYVSYATKMSPILGDSENCSEVKSFKSLVAEELCVDKSFEKDRSALASSSMSTSVGGGGKELTSKVSNTSVAVLKDRMVLHDAIVSIYEDLFERSPSDCVSKLTSPPLIKDEVEVYNAFLLGKVLENVANFIEIPHAPWIDFVNVHHVSTLQRLVLDVKDYLDDSLEETYIPMQAGTKDSEGIRSYIRNRLKKFM